MIEKSVVWILIIFECVCVCECVRTCVCVYIHTYIRLIMHTVFANVCMYVLI